MAPPKIRPTGIERTFDKTEIIVSKTDLKGRITYANDVFLRVSQYREDEILGQPHNCIRHPDMPRCVFQLLWDTIQAGREIFALVINLAKSGDFYWVLAHVTPTYDHSGNVIGYHSSRRVPERSSIQKIVPIYKTLLDIERPIHNPKEAIAASMPVMLKLLKDNNVTYEEFIFSLVS